MRYLVVILMLFQVGCVTLLKRPEHRHHYCVLQMFDKGVSAELSNKICKDIWRNKGE